MARATKAPAPAPAETALPQVGEFYELQDETLAGHGYLIERADVLESQIYVKAVKLVGGTIQDANWPGGIDWASFMHSVKSGYLKKVDMTGWE